MPLSLGALLVGGCWFDLVSPDDISTSSATVAADVDDVMWTYCHLPAANVSLVHPQHPDVFVSASADCGPPDPCDECVGFRFPAKVPARARVLEAHLVANIEWTGEDNAVANASAPLQLLVSVYDDVGVTFDPTSTTPPLAVAPTFPSRVWTIGNAIGEVRSVDLKDDIQKLVDRDDYDTASTLALFVDGAPLPNDKTYFGFSDSSGGVGAARLEVRYLPASEP